MLCACVRGGKKIKMQENYNLNDGVDTIHKNNEMLVILKNVMNDLNARDTSSKIRSVKQSTFKSEKFVGRYAPIGYRKSSADKHILEIDPVTAPIVRRIFDMRLQGDTFRKIARTLNEEGALSPRLILDRIFKRIYEDDISGAISHDRFLKLSAEYEAEQRELEEKVKADQQEVDTYEQNKSDFDSFAAIIRKYVGIKELTPAIVNEFIKKIIVHAPEKVDGKRVQKVDIIFNFVGELNFLSATQPKRQGA